jgi:hypothetical protein
VGILFLPKALHTSISEFFSDFCLSKSFSKDYEGITEEYPSLDMMDFFVKEFSG